MEANTPTVVDLFCGCGGISWGLEKAGFRTIAGIDNWKPALDTFKYNHPHALALTEDLSKFDPAILLERLKITPGQLDVVVGGPPCQGFSKNVPAVYRFLEDSRNQLFKDFLNFVSVVKPKTVVMENVAEIYNAFSGSVRKEIVNTLNKLGYEVVVSVLFMPDYGIPQRRRRCIFFASNTGISPELPRPSFQEKEIISLFDCVRKYRSAWDAISDLPPLRDGEGYEPMPYTSEPLNDYQVEMRGDAPEIYDHITRKLVAKQYARLASIKPGEGMKELPPELQPKSGYSGAYGRLDFVNMAPTITRWVFHPGSGRFGHPKDIRVITIREAARLQSFSDDFRFTGTYLQKAGQVGNAVPPLIMKLLGNNIKSCLKC